MGDLYVSVCVDAEGKRKHFTAGDGIPGWLHPLAYDRNDPPNWRLGAFQINRSAFFFSCSRYRIPHVTREIRAAQGLRNGKRELEIRTPYLYVTLIVIAVSASPSPLLATITTASSALMSATVQLLPAFEILVFESMAMVWEAF